MHSLEAVVPLPRSHLRAFDDSWWAGIVEDVGLWPRTGVEGSTELRSYLRATEVISGQTQVELTWP